MLNSKFDINSQEWIERVFENRNKSYGAYELRKQSAGNTNRALAIVIFALAAVFAISAYVLGGKPESVAANKGVIDVTNQPIQVAPETGKGTKQIKATQAEIEQSVKNGALGVKDKLGQSAPVRVRDLDVQPLPVGGAAAWKQFLETNLHYPAEARDQRISGDVQVSFIVERDGSISNIAIDQPAGHGFDEEALRVLKLSPRWTAGMQNNQAVRVKYSMPINFHIERR